MTDTTDTIATQTRCQRCDALIEAPDEMTPVALKVGDRPFGPWTCCETCAVILVDLIATWGANQE